MECGLELSAVVGLNHLNAEGQLLEHVVDELDGRLRNCPKLRLDFQRWTQQLPGLLRTAPV